MKAVAPRFVSFVTVAIPVLNEQAHIGACLASLLPQLDPCRCEVLVLDGGSSDETTAVVSAMSCHYPFVRLVSNPGRLQSAACNLAARLADPRARVLLRADAHAFYPPNFVALCLAALDSSGATSVVVPMLTVGATGFQRAVAATQNSNLGNGGSIHRAGGVSAFVDHGHHAVFNLDFFRRIGGYDEGFSHNEDAEFDLRGGRAGARVWMCREAVMHYVPRKTATALARQYFGHGAGRARTLVRHACWPRPRQMLPVAVLTSILLSMPAALISPLTLLVPIVYAVCCCSWGAAIALRKSDTWLLAMGPAAMIIHLAWATGFMRQILIRPRPASDALQEPA